MGSLPVPARPPQRGLLPTVKKGTPPPSVDYTRNPRQAEFIGLILQVIAAFQRPGEVEDPGYRVFHYGGAITGGKTIAALGAACLLAKAFPGSRWHVVRAAFPDIRRTVLPSVDKVLGAASKGLRWRRSSDDYYFEMRNGSRVYMFAENFARDKDLNRWKGLETNGFIFEQLEEIQEATYIKAFERAGRWYNVRGPMPPPLILTTFNPTWNWIKEKIHDRAELGQLPPDEVFIRALPDDNPFVTGEQWKSWKKMPPDVYDRFIKGRWELDVKGQFLNMFKDEHVVNGLRYRPAHELWISFDFNVDPMCAIVFQTDGETFFHVLKEYRVTGDTNGEDGGDVFQVCDAIKVDWFHLKPMLRITGDATGDSRLSGQRGAVSQYRIISEELGIEPEEFTLASRNPFIADSRIYCNAVVRWIPDFKVDGERCPYLVKDCRFAQVGRNSEGKLAKQVHGLNPYTNLPNSEMWHLLDTLRYGIHAGVPNFVDIPRS